MPLRTRRDRERLRQSFRPQRVHLLFVGESPPASGRFFYAADSGLYRAMFTAFQIADPNLREEDFLAVFRSRGCYLTDLCPEPVDHLAPKLRQAMRDGGEKSLSREITRLQPAIVAPVLRSIVRNVANAVGRAKWRGELFELPYPGRWVVHRDAFVKALVPVIRDLQVQEHRSIEGVE